MEKVFVSYSRQDSDFVLELVKQLKLNNVPIWLDQYDIPPGKRWDIAIEEALDEATHLLFIASENSVKSQNVRDEIDFAMDANKMIVPIVLDDARLPLRVRRLQYTDFRADYDKAFTELMNILPRGIAAKLEQSSTQADKHSENDPVTTTQTQVPIPDFDEPLPEIEGFTVEHLISNTGLSSIYVARDDAGKKYILKRRLKDPVPAIDFSKLDIHHDGLAIPTLVYEDNDFIYETAKYHEGWSLSEIIMMNVGKIRGDLLLLWAEELVEIVSVLHSHNPPIIHRDIKPDNILVTPDKHNLILLDLSSAVFYEPEKTYDTLGTIGYVPPEQLQGKPTPASDLYAIAATLHRMNTGEQPPNILERKLGRSHFEFNGVRGFDDIFKAIASLELEKRANDAKNVLDMFNLRKKRPDDPDTQKSDNELIRGIIKGEAKVNTVDVLFPDGSTIPTQIIDWNKAIISI